jgi:hypothetical protein
MPYHPSTTDEWFCQAFSSEMQAWTEQKPSKLFKSNSCAVVVVNKKTQLKRTANRHYLLVSLPEPLPLASLVLRHAWFEHASLNCKANVKKGDYVSDFIHDSGKLAELACTTSSALPRLP